MRGAAKREKGVIDAVVDLKAKTATVTFDSAVTTPERIAKAITASGFPARVPTRKPS